MDQGQELLNWGSAVTASIPTLVGAVIALLGSIVGAGASSFVTWKLQQQRIAHEDTVRVDSLRRELLGRFDHVRREVYSKLIGAVRSFVTDSVHLFPTDISEADGVKRMFDDYSLIAKLQAEVAIIGTAGSVATSSKVLDVVTNVYAEMMKMRREHEADAERLWAASGTWGKHVDAALEEFVRAVREELRIVELGSDPVSGDTKTA